MTVCFLWCILASRLGPQLIESAACMVGVLWVFSPTRELGCIFSKLGTQIFLPKFPGGQPTTDRVPSLEQVLLV